MISFFKTRRKFILAGMVGLLLVIAVVYLSRESTVGQPSGTVSASELDRYEQSVQEAPFDGSLLLRSARHHYFYVRQANGSPEVLRQRLRRGLRHYRRIVAGEEWTMSPRDYFYGAYMYYRLGQLSGDASRQSAYFTRAREMGLSSYERGHRSAELLTLLGNLHFRSGEYEVALDYYSSLGDGVNDPEVLFNKGWVHRSMGNYDRALELVEQALERLPSDAVDRRRQYRLARFRILIDQGNARDVIEPLRGMEGFDQDLRARTLYAEALVDLGFEQEARQALREIVNQNNPPDRARRLLEQLRSDQSDVGS